MMFFIFDSIAKKRNSIVSLLFFAILSNMKNIIQFTISEEDGFYTASGENTPIVTQGKTFEELKSKILEAAELFFEGENPAELGFGNAPSILTNFELTSRFHGVNA